ncbi:MAG: sensor histidine kinase [Nocardioides sp.]
MPVSRGRSSLRSLGMRLWVLIAVLALMQGAAAYALASWVDQVRIGGDRYDAIVAARALETQAQSSELRLDDMQLAVQELAVSPKDPALQLARLERLRVDYEERTAPIVAAADQAELKNAMSEVVQAAAAYFAELDGAFAQAAGDGNKKVLRNLATGSLADKFLAHSNQVDGVVDLSAAEAARAEQEAGREFVARRNAALGIGVGLLALAALSCWFTMHGIAKRLRGMQDSATIEFPRLLAEADQAGESVVMPVPYPGPPTAGRDQLARTERAMQEVISSAMIATYHRARQRQITADTLSHFGRQNQRLAATALESGRKGSAELRESLLALDRTARQMLAIGGAPADEREPTAIAELVTAAAPPHSESRYISSLDHATVGAEAVADVEQILGELFDNALRHSPAGTKVAIVGEATQREYHLSICDQGLGIEPTRLSELNELLLSGEDDVYESRQLGLTVVSRLALRNDIEVSLSAERHGGITALVRLPAPVLTDGEGISAVAAEREVETEAKWIEDTWTIEPITDIEPVPLRNPGDLNGHPATAVGRAATGGYGGSGDGLAAAPAEGRFGDDRFGDDLFDDDQPDEGEDVEEAEEVEESADYEFARRYVGDTVSSWRPGTMDYGRGSGADVADDEPDADLDDNSDDDPGEAADEGLPRRIRGGTLTEIQLAAVAGADQSLKSPVRPRTAEESAATLAAWSSGIRRAMNELDEKVGYSQ